jgi:hypothetical protein
VTGRGVPDGDMPISLRPDQGDVPQLGDPAFDALLARALRPEEAVASLRPMAESFAALYAAPVQSAPVAEASALTAFRGLAAQSRSQIGQSYSQAGQSHGRAGRDQAGLHRTGGWVRSRLVGVRLAVAAAAVALTASSAAAAYAGMLPAPAQRLAHAIIGAPLGSGGGQPEPGAPGPSPLPGSSTYGLCQAYERAMAHGHPGRNPVAFRRLAAAAGGASRVTAYCAQVIHPGSPANSQPAHPQHGKPSELPTHHGKATPAASHHGKPSALPTPAATHHGKPTGTAGRSAAK